MTVRSRPFVMESGKSHYAKVMVGACSSRTVGSLSVVKGAEISRVRWNF
jgi:hypothetical protein